MTKVKFNQIITGVELKGPGIEGKNVSLEVQVDQSLWTDGQVRLTDFDQKGQSFVQFSGALPDVIKNGTVTHNSRNLGKTLYQLSEEQIDWLKQLQPTLDEIASDGIELNRLHALLNNIELGED